MNSLSCMVDCTFGSQRPWTCSHAIRTSIVFTSCQIFGREITAEYVRRIRPARPMLPGGCSLVTLFRRGLSIPSIVGRRVKVKRGPGSCLSSARQTEDRVVSMNYPGGRSPFCSPQFFTRVVYQEKTDRRSRERRFAPRLPVRVVRLTNR